MVIVALRDDEKNLIGYYGKHEYDRKDEVYKIIKNADLVKEINDHYFAGCYQVRNEWMVDRLNLVITVFNGKKSGTNNTVDYALKMIKSK